MLQLGYDVLVSDVDAVFLNDPRPYLSADTVVAHADVWVSTDCLSPSQVGGLTPPPSNNTKIR